jgi:hypothetical protein
VIPTSDYFPAISEGEYSSGVFEAKSTDTPMTVTGRPGTAGLWNPDSETFKDVVVPRWPSSVVPASGTDGHADIVDVSSGIVHSFWQLKYQDGKWVAAQYTWTRLDGRGFGDPSHYFQGSRAAGVPTMAGMIRKHEINDGDTMYRHALAMSLTYNGLSANPTYIFPATSSDSDAASTNTGAISQGALLMLPPSFNTGAIANPALRKVAETLKTYGAYVVDRNHGTPFVIYAENGSGFDLHKNGWDNQVANDLQTIRQMLRQVVSASAWLGANGQQYTQNKNLNLLSMRGPWQLQQGGTAATFDSWSQMLVFPSSQTRIVQMNSSPRSMQPVNWAIPVGGQSYRLSVRATGGATLRFQLVDRSSGTSAFDSGSLQNGQTATFLWPRSAVDLRLVASSGIGQASSVSAELLKAAP